jgi:hypothetical protein
MKIVDPGRPVQSVAVVLMLVLSAITLSAEPLAAAVIQLVVALGVAMSPELQDALITVVRIVAQILVSAGVVQFAANLQKAAVTPVANPTLPAGSVVKVEGSEDQVEIQPSPPGPVAIEGGGVG